MTTILTATPDDQPERLPVLDSDYLWRAEERLAADRDFLAMVMRMPVAQAGRVVSGLEVEDFVDWRLRSVFGVMKDLIAAGNDPRAQAVYARLLGAVKSGDDHRLQVLLSTLYELIERIIAPATADYLRERILRQSLNRCIGQAALRMAQAAEQAELHVALEVSREGFSRISRTVQRVRGVVGDGFDAAGRG